MSYQRFLAELKRRKVFKVAALYGVVAFVVLQVADLVLPALAIPEWGMRLVLVLILLGFPIALVFAWAFEATPDGVKRDEGAATGEITQIMSLPPSSRWPSGIAALVGVALLVTGAWWVGRRSAAADGAADGGRTSSVEGRDARAGDRSGRTAIAVLPFDNIAGDSESEYFVDGVHDEIITQLSKIGGLSVTSRTSVMAYKGERPSIREVADELQVDVVLEGSVRHAPNRVRITAQLIDVTTDEHLWADSYDRELTDILAIQSDVALKVADALEAQLTPEESARIEATLTDNLDAYDLYLRGNERLYASFQEQDLRPAEQLFLRATELDPSFAAAYAYLSIARGRLYWFFYDRSEEIEQATRTAAERAVSLDPDLAAAQLADGMYHYRISLDYVRALEALERAAELRPGSAEIEAATGWVYRRKGDWDVALRQMMDAQGRDPRDPRFAFSVGETLYLMRDYEAAVRSLERTVELDPTRPTAYNTLAYAQLATDGDAARALETLDRARTVGASGRGSEYVRIDLLHMWGDHDAALAATLRLDAALNTQNVYRPPSMRLGFSRLWAGEDAAARADLEAAAVELEALTAEQPDDPRYHSALGIVYAGLGRDDDALREARLAVEIMPVEREAFRGPSHERDLARVLTMTGAYDEAIDQLIRILGRPSQLTPAALRLHPMWEPLRDDPRFQELVAER